MFSASPSGSSEASSLGSSGRSWQDEAREVLGSSAPASPGGSAPLREFFLILLFAFVVVWVSAQTCFGLTSMLSPPSSRPEAALIQKLAAGMIPFHMIFASFTFPHELSWLAAHLEDLHKACHQADSSSRLSASAYMNPRIWMAMHHMCTSQP